MAKKALATIEEGETAVSVAYGCAALLDAGLAEQLGLPTAEEEGLDAGGQLAVRSARRLQVLKHNLEVCREGLARIREELHGWRRRRKLANETLYAKAKRLRGFCRSAYQEGEGDAFLGLHGVLPREPKELHAVFGPVVRRLADVEWPMPEHDLVGFKVDREELVKDLIEAHGELGRVLAAIKQGETREAVAQMAKNRAAEAHGVFLGKSARFLEAAMELGGLDELAASVRPGTGRVGRPAKKQLIAAGDLAREGKALPATTGGATVAELPAAEVPESVEGAGTEPLPSAGAPESPD